jgi:hypothetical protein
LVKHRNVTTPPGEDLRTSLYSEIQETGTREFDEEIRIQQEAELKSAKEKIQMLNRLLDESKQKRILVFSQNEKKKEHEELIARVGIL